ncbi:MAG: acyltransferase [Dysgonamonadaceae bacterium]
MITQTTYKRMFELIDVMRFPLIFLVVIAHMVGFDTPRVHLSMTPDNIYTLISQMISHNLAKISVSFYFLVSGYFFFIKFQNWDLSNYSHALQKKGKTLLVPYLFWNIIIVIMTLLVNYAGYFWGIDREKVEIPSFYNTFWGMPANYPLWYLRDLMCMMVISPAIYFLIKKMKMIYLCLLILAYFMGLEIGIPGFSTTAFLFFSFGGYFAIYNVDWLTICSKVRKSSILIAALFLMAATLSNGMKYHEIVLKAFIFTGIIASVNLFDYLLKYKMLKNFLLFFSSSSFFIYVIHEVYIINWLKGGFLRLSISNSLAGKLTGYFLIPCICILICWGLYFLMKKYCPGILAFVTGGRLSTHLKEK